MDDCVSDSNKVVENTILRKGKPFLYIVPSMEAALALSRMILNQCLSLTQEFSFVGELLEPLCNPLGGDPTGVVSSLWLQ